MVLSVAAATGDYASDPVHTLKRFWFHHSWVLATWVLLNA